MKQFITYIISLVCCSSITAQISTYDVIWDQPSANASASMPCGGSDIGMNVWVEQGDLFVYVARSGHYDEHNTLLKAGRLRFRFSGDPFRGGYFRQQLHLEQGYVTVTGKNNGVTVTVKIWADVAKPVAHYEISSSKKVAVDVAYESWRYKDRIVQPREYFSNSWKWAPPKNIYYKADHISFQNNTVLFYHHNRDSTIFDATVRQQGMDAVKSQLYDPLKDLAAGGLLFGPGFREAGSDTGTYVHTDFRAWKLAASPAKQHHLYLALHDEQSADINTWQASLRQLQSQALGDRTAADRSIQWWKQFWQRSFININGTHQDSAWMMGRNYQLFRYMLACNARGKWPTKFNGGLFTVDPVYTDKSTLTPDFRNWGGGLHTAQNQRLVYFPMIRSGDFDLLQTQLQFYLRLQGNAEFRSKLYWNHAGACFTEQMENFGLPNYAEYGVKRPATFDKGVEYNAWLEYEWDTVFEFCLMMLQEYEYMGNNINERIPFIISCLRFFDEHYQYLARQRGIKSLDGNGKLVLYPGSGGETFKMATNATSTIAALQTITSEMLRLPNTVLDTTTRRYLLGLEQRIPPISYRSFNGKTTISPAKSWERVNNVETMQLYPVYPWRMFAVGKPGLDTARNTWYYDTLALRFRSHIGWKQDNIFAATLGLTNEAWQLTYLKLRNGERRFPAFWGPGFDWVPDHNWGGSGMIGLQEMLMQTDGDRIILFPAWPKEKDVHFKLHAPKNTTVEATLKNGQVTSLIVMPESRRKDVVIM